MIMCKLMIFFGWTNPLIQLYLPLAFKEWWKSPIFRRKPGGCLIFTYRPSDARWCQSRSVFCSWHGSSCQSAGPTSSDPQQPSHPTHPWSLAVFLPLLFSSPHPSTFLHPPSIHTRDSLLPHCPVLSHIPQVCTQSHIVCVSYRAHSQGSFRTHIHPTGCVHSRTDEFTHTYTYSFIKLIDMHSWVHTTTNAHTDFHMCTLYTHSSAYTGCLTPRPRFQFPYSFFYASTHFLQFDLLIPRALHIFSPPLFPHWDRWYDRCFIVIGLWNSYIKEINLNKWLTTWGKTQQKYWWRFLKSF